MISFFLSFLPFRYTSDDISDTKLFNTPVQEISIGFDRNNKVSRIFQISVETLCQEEQAPPQSEEGRWGNPLPHPNVLCNYGRPSPLLILAIRGFLSYVFLGFLPRPERNPMKALARKSTVNTIIV